MNKNNIKNIQLAFESLKLSGRPDVLDAEAENLTPKLYVDFSTDNYFIDKAKNSNLSTIFIGRRGSGKSTIFLTAMYQLRDNKNFGGIYINLQSCFEEIFSTDELSQEDMNKLFMRRFLTRFYDAFESDLLNHIKKKDLKKIDKDFIQELIDQGRRVESFSEKDVSVETETKKEKSVETNTSFFPFPKLSGKIRAGKGDMQKISESYTVSIERKNSLSDILIEIDHTLERLGISKLILYLDDFSELSEVFQKLVINTVIQPIISSYNKNFTIKLAVYPNKFFIGNIDQTKIEFADLGEYKIDKSKPLESKINSSKIFIQKVLETRLSVFKVNIDLKDIFEEDLDLILETLFYVTDNIPRILGFILDYCVEYALKKGEAVSLDTIDAASKHYYESQIQRDFENTLRSYETYKLRLNYAERIFLRDKLIELAILQKSIIKTQLQFESNKASENKVRKLIKNRKKSFNILSRAGSKASEIVKNSYSKKGKNYIIPSSHFIIFKGDDEKFIQSLELGFIVNKLVNQGDLDGKEVALYCLNYGLCKSSKIDYGIGKHRKYRIQRFFNYSDFFRNTVLGFKKVVCKKNNCELSSIDQQQLETFLNYKQLCPICKEEESLFEERKYTPQILEILNEQEELMKKLEKLKIPEHYFDVITFLRDNEENYYAPKELARILDKSVPSMIGACTSLRRRAYIKRHSEIAKYKYLDAEIFFT